MKRGERTECVRVTFSRVGATNRCILEKCQRNATFFVEKRRKLSFCGDTGREKGAKTVMVLWHTITEDG